MLAQVRRYFGYLGYAGETAVCITPSCWVPNSGDNQLPERSEILGLGGCFFFFFFPVRSVQQKDSPLSFSLCLAAGDGKPANI